MNRGVGQRARLGGEAHVSRAAQIDGRVVSGRPSPVVARQRLLRHHEVEPLGADVLVHVVPGGVGVIPGTADARHVPGVQHLLAVNDLAGDTEPLHDERESR